MHDSLKVVLNSILLNMLKTNVIGDQQCLYNASKKNMQLLYIYTVSQKNVPLLFFQ